MLLTSWDTEYSSQSPASDRLLEIIVDHDLSKHLKEPTRRDRNIQNILDLILSINSNIIKNVSVVPGISDHDIVLFTKERKMSNAKYSLKKKQTLLAFKTNLQNYHFIWIHGALTQSMKNGAASKITSTI